MTDIPVGSPPAPPGRHAAPGGWYPDPLDSHKERYWDGWQWSKNTRDLEARGGASAPGSGQTYPPAAAAYGQGQPTPSDLSGSSQPPQGDAYGQNTYGQGQPYGQGQYPPGQPHDQGQDPYGQGQNPYDQGQYGQGQNPYGQGQNPYGQGQNPYGQGQYPPGQYGSGPYPGSQPPGWAGGNVPGQKAVATADGVRLAGWWWRVLAMILDSVVIALIAAIPSLPIYSRVFGAIARYVRESARAGQTGQTPPPVPDTTSLVSGSDQLVLTVIGLIVGIAYHAIFVRLKSATPGKLICGLRVVPVDQGQFAGRLPWSTAVIRAAVWVLSGAQTYLVILRIVDALFPLWHPKRQALHDLAARTQVVRRG